MSVRKVVVDTDIMVGHLLSSGRGPSDLRRLMSHCFCYTTVFNAVELFSICATPGETEAVGHVMHAMKILGMNAKNGKNLGPLVRNARRRRQRDLDALIAGLCVESRLALVTHQPGRYRGMGRLQVMTVRHVLESKEKGGR